MFTPECATPAAEVVKTMTNPHPLGASLAQDVVTSLLASGKLADSLAADLTSAITNCLQHKWRTMPPHQAAAVSALLRAGRPKQEPRVIPTAAETGQQPAVSVERSVLHDHIICLEDGRELKMLKRYLREHYGLSPDEYRHKWGLPADYPMVAPAYLVQAVYRVDNG